MPNIRHVPHRKKKEDGSLLQEGAAFVFMHYAALESPHSSFRCSGFCLLCLTNWLSIPISWRGSLSYDVKHHIMLTCHMILGILGYPSGAFLAAHARAKGLDMMNAANQNSKISLKARFFHVQGFLAATESKTWAASSQLAACKLLSMHAAAARRT